mmetsp:Transcript_36830/g.111203  ORF Transcript_36830/g.111203 Transcript_36830/m.111203 type:complete len:217 (-) Transcript_36830:101-751(-)
MVTKKLVPLLTTATPRDCFLLASLGSLAPWPSWPSLPSLASLASSFASSLASLPSLSSLPFLSSLPSFWSACSLCLSCSCCRSCSLGRSCCFCRSCSDFFSAGSLSKIAFSTCAAAALTMLIALPESAAATAPDVVDLPSAVCLAWAVSSPSATGSLGLKARPIELSGLTVAGEGLIPTVCPEMLTLCIMMAICAAWRCSNSMVAILPPRTSSSTV